MQAKTFSTDGYCAPSVPTCTTPSTLVAINPADLPDELNQVSRLDWRTNPEGQDVRVCVRRLHRAKPHDLPLEHAAGVRAAAGRKHGEMSGDYRQTLINGRVDHKLTPSQTLMVRGNYDHFYDTNPNDAVVGTNAPTVARRYTRGSRSVGINHTTVARSNLLNEARFAYLDGAPVTLWEAQEILPRPTRAPDPSRSRLANRAKPTSSGTKCSCADTVSWARGRHNLRFGGSVIRHTTGGSGSEPGQATLGTFTFLSTTTAPFESPDAGGRPEVFAASQLWHHQL